MRIIQAPGALSCVGELTQKSPAIRNFEIAASHQRLTVLGEISSSYLDISSARGWQTDLCFRVITETSNLD